MTWAGPALVFVPVIGGVSQYILLPEAEQRLTPHCSQDACIVSKSSHATLAPEATHTSNKNNENDNEKPQKLLIEKLLKFYIELLFLSTW